jgi:CheY-like chemotaxis protein
MNILIVDDEFISQSVLREQLESLGHNVAVASDGEEGWKFFEAAKYQVVVTDWLMPKTDGLELTRRIRAENREGYVYIIFLTILHGKGSYLEAMDAGADDFISKPFDSDQLRARLRVAERILNMRHEIKRLGGLLPICSHCRKIRDVDDEWLSLESYFTKKTETMFSHGVCPDCYKIHYSASYEKRKKGALFTEE